MGRSGLGGLDDPQARVFGPETLDLHEEPAVLGLKALELRVRVRHGFELRLHGFELHDVLILLVRLFARPAVGAVALVDRGPQAGAEAALGLQLDAVLLGQRDREGRAGDAAALDQDRAQEAAGPLLLLERMRELLGRDEALVHE